MIRVFQVHEGFLFLFLFCCFFSLKAHSPWEERVGTLSWMGVRRSCSELRKS
jgi:hypothetical protein